MSVVPFLRRHSGLLFVALLLLLWEIAADYFKVRSLPPFSRVALAYWTIVTGSALGEHVLPSLGRALAGFAIGTVAGAAIGLAIGITRAAEPWVRPVLEFGRSLPAPVILPAALLLLGATPSMRIAIIALGCTFPVILNAIDGARRVDPLMIDTARAFGLDTMAVLRRVIFPAALPQMLAGARISVSIALIMMVISELIAASSGIGVLLFQSQRLFRVADTYAVVLLLGTLGWLLTLLFVRIERRAVGWQAGWSGRGND